MRLQVAFDYLMVFTFVLLVFTIIFSSIAKQRVEFSSEQSFAQLQVIAQTIASEISNAGQGGNGFTAAISLPSELSIIQYTVSITKYGSVIVSSDQYGQEVQAVAFSGQYSIVSNPSYYANPPHNTFYTIPTYNGTGTITFQNALGTICVDYSCPASSNQISQLTVTKQVTQAAYFNGQDGYLNYNNGAIFNSQPPVSMSAWFMPIGTISSSKNCPNTECYAIASKPGYAEDWDMYVGAGNILYFKLCTTTSSCTNLAYPSPLSSGKWYNAVATFGEGSLILYVNGIPVNSISGLSNSRATSLNNFCVGWNCYWNQDPSYSSLSSYFSGEIANVQFYTSALTGPQVSSLYSEGISGAPVNTLSIGFWSPLNGNANDYSGNGYNGQAYGPVNYPTVAQISATAINSTGSSISGALIGFSSSSGNFINGPSAANFTNSNGIAYSILSQTAPSGPANVHAIAFNGNTSTTANLIAWFPLNLGQGSLIFDTSNSGTGNPSGYLQGNVVGASWASPNFVAHFDGQSSYIQIPYSASQRLSELTINGWVNVTGTSAGHFSWLVGKYGAYGLGVCGNSLLVCYYDYSGSGQEHDSGASLLPNTWYMLTAVISSSTSTPGNEILYVNGVQVLNGPLLINTLNYPFQIGGVALPQGANSQFFNGSASNIQIYSQALTQNQISSLYNMGIGGNPIPGNLLGWWPLNGNAQDFSGNGYNGTIYGNLTMSKPSGIGGQFGPSHLLYASFNGISSYVQATNTTSFQSLSNTITITGWANYTSNSIGYIGWLAAKVNAYGLGTCGPSLIVCYYNWGSVGTGEHDSSTALLPNNWYMLSAVINGPANTETVYVNGANVLSGPLFLASTANAFDIGACQSCGQYMDGGASNIQIYSGALTQGQIQQLYQQGISSTPLLNAHILSWFPLDGDTNDYSNQNDAGIATNVVYYSQNINPPYQTPSISGYGMYFNGQTSNVVISNPMRLSNPAVTVSAWVYPVSSHNAGNFQEVANNSGAYGLGIDKNGNMEAYFSVRTSAWQTPVNTVYSLNTNSWYMLTGVYNGTGTYGTLDLYVNGILVANSIIAAASLYSSAGISSIGSYSSSPFSNIFNGTIADVQVYNSALNSQQVSQLYDAGLPISQTVTVPMGGVPP